MKFKIYIRYNSKYATSTSAKLNLQSKEAQEHGGGLVERRVTVH